MKAATETGLVKSCLDLLHLCGIFCWRNQTMGTFDPVRKRYRSFHGLKGVSDIIGVIDSPSVFPKEHGKILAIELKTATGRLSPEQRWFLAEIERRGGYAWTIRSLDDLASALRDLGYSV